MHAAIKDFPKQFEYAPVVENGGKLKKYSHFIVLGMGGSNLAPELLKIANPHLDIKSHRNYGLPAIEPKTAKETLIIANSYSGNTEEVLDGFKFAVRKNLPVAAIATGGKLLEMARKFKKPYVQIPDSAIQPRVSLGLQAKALLQLMHDKNMMREATALAKLLKSYELERVGRALAKKLKDNVPIIYSSEANLAIAYNWKIKLNETAKIPAFLNKFPELNHNEMTGFDVKESTAHLSKHFYFIFLKDMNDHPKIIKRMNITERLYRERGLPVEPMILGGKNVLYKIFSSLLLADWTSYYLAEQYGVDPEKVPMVEEFKKLIR